jgi:peptidoglycan/xylan/chitin deacetylase (PgdA/CDA1 family)
MYHDVAGPEEHSGFRAASARRYQLSLSQFITHLDTIGKSTLRPRSVFDLPADSDALLLTFDDGGASAMRVADLLDARGWKGHFFLTTGLLDTAGFVTRGDARELHRRGHIIGSHSHSHPNICYNLNDEEMLAEWRTSCVLLADILGAPVTTASVPGGDMNRQTVAMAAKAGIKCLFTSEPTPYAWHCEGIKCFGRVCLMSDGPQDELDQLLRFKGFGRRRAVRWGKQLVKRLVGPLYRAQMPKRYLETASK